MLAAATYAVPIWALDLSKEKAFYPVLALNRTITASQRLTLTMTVVN